jgi:hypothetical protein
VHVTDQEPDPLAGLDASVSSPEVTELLREMGRREAALPTQIRALRKWRNLELQDRLLEDH